MAKLKRGLPILFYLVIATIFFISGNIFRGKEEGKYNPGKYPGRIILGWNDSVYNTQTITWRTDTTIRAGYVQWGPAVDVAEELTDTFKTRANSSFFRSDVNVSFYHKAKLSGLKPGRQYQYRVGNEGYWSEWFQFRTAYKEMRDFSFLYFGDMQNDLKSNCSRVIRKAIMTCPDAGFLLFGGDLVNDPEDNQWGEWFGIGQWAYSSIPVLAAAGNHEYRRNLRGGLGNHWKYQFTFPENGPEGYKSSVFYVDYQGVRFIILDTEGMSEGLTGSYQIQSKWLENVLANNPNRWSVVTMHHPLFSGKAGRDNHKLRKFLKPVFDKYNVDLVLQGHDHSYARSGFMPKDNSSGPIYVISVTGPKMYDSTLSQEMERLATCTQLFQRIDVSEDKITYSSFTATGKLYDHFVLHKNKEGQKSLHETIPAGQPERLQLSKLFQGKFTKEEIDAYHKKVELRRAKLLTLSN